MLLVGTLLLVVGCGGGDEDSMRATLTDEGCTYQGTSTPESGVFTVAVDNQTDRFANFALGEYIAGPERGAVAGIVSPPLPKRRSSDVAYIRLIAHTEVEPHAASELPSNQEPAGKYVVACVIHGVVGEDQNSIEGAYIATLLRVGDG